MGARGVGLHSEATHCPGCEHFVAGSICKLPGVTRVASEPCTATPREGERRILPGATGARQGRLAQLLLGLIGISLILLLDTELIGNPLVSEAPRKTSYGLILVLGLLTSLHCVGMCGGFVLSYTAEAARLGKPSYLAHVLYGVGKTLSYVRMGALSGLLGAIFTFTPLLRGIGSSFAGVLLILFGLNMLGLFTRANGPRLTWPTPFARFFAKSPRTGYRPFFIGLMNGLMIACGPLQAMYVMAAGTGSAFEGAKILFAFGIGTLPVLLSFGVLTTLISGALTQRLLRASGGIVILLGAVMINRGLILFGGGYDLRSLVAAVSG